MAQIEISVYVPFEDYNKFESAAEAIDQSMSAFMREAGRERAQRVMLEEDIDDLNGGEYGGDAGDE